MSTEKEFGRWLRRPDCTLEDNLKFAINAWKSSEFMLSNKYEIILEWLVEEGARLYENTCNEELPEKELIALLQLRAPSGLVAQKVKSEFVEMLLKLTRLRFKLTNRRSRLYAEIIRYLNEFEIVQDYYRSNYDAHGQVYGTLLQIYEEYLRQFITTTENAINLTHENEFFGSVLHTLQDDAKQARDVGEFENSYRAYILQPLVEVILLLRTKSVSFFDDILAIESVLTESFSCYDLLERLLTLPLHVRLLAIECSIVNRRAVEMYQKALLKKSVGALFVTNSEKQQPELGLNVTAYILEMLWKHNIFLNFTMTEDETIFSFLGNRLIEHVKEYKEKYLREVLMVLCATLRLNPLILEKHIFEITAWMIVAEKSDDSQELQQQFEEYLVLLMDMFRRLSRAEKFVANLLKALKKWLTHSVIMGDTKRKANETNTVPHKTPKKRRKLNELQSEAIPADDVNTNEFYVKLVFQNVCNKYPTAASKSTTAVITEFNSFPQLHGAWPSASVGSAFSKLIAGLMSKPSIVIWKSLLYSLKELLETLETVICACSENDLLNLDMHAALLCQYFAGCKLTEQADKYLNEIMEQRHLTAQILATFGRFLLAREHHKRTMNAFLECSFHAAAFDLLLAYYLPDGVVAAEFHASLLEQLHPYLTTEEWTLMQQRVLNFGKSSCIYLFNRLLLQKKHAKLLLTGHVPAVGDGNGNSINLNKIMLASTHEDRTQLKELLKASNNQWIIRNLHRDEKSALAKTLLLEVDVQQVFHDDLEALEFMMIAAYEHLAHLFQTSCKSTSLLASLKCDFEATRKLLTVADVTAYDKHIREWVSIINERPREYHIKKLPHEGDIKQVLTVLKQLPIGNLRRQSKTVCFVLHLAFYSDLKAAGAVVTEPSEVNELALESFVLLTGLLHFGQQVPIFKYFPIETIIKLLPVASCWEFYEFIFNYIKNEEKNTERFLTSLVDLLNGVQKNADCKFPDDYRRLMLLAIETLAAISGPCAKRIRKHLNALLTIYGAYVRAYFDSNWFAANESHSPSNKKDKKFVEKTLPGYAPYVSSIVAGNISIDDDQQKIDEHFIRISKIYIGYSMDYRNTHGIRLMQVALTNRQQLQLDQAEIEFVLSNYWTQLNDDIRAGELLTNDRTDSTTKTTEAVVKLVISNKTNEDLLLTLKQIGTDAIEKDYGSIARLLELIAKCPFSTIKGAIFNEQFKQITSDIIMRCAKNPQQQFINKDHVLYLLTAQQAIIENKMVPLSIDTLDSILAFLMDINIKKYATNEAVTASTNESRSFYQLHTAINDVCTSLLKHRHISLMDRIPQLMHIFKDLLQSVIWYKSDRQKDTPLSESELDNLAELCMRLELFSHILATHSIDVKRVAPFILTFVINLMVSNKRPTTLYPQIKTYIESICYDLISICDHRVGRFILRCSNDAARQVYELLVKDHKKYHKFKGKI